MNRAENRTGLSVEQSLLLNDACDAFEMQWKSGERPDLAATIKLPLSIRSVAMSELIHLDVFYRRKAGETPAATDYSTRFPNLSAPWLADAVAIDSSTLTGAATTTLRPDALLGSFGDYELLEEIARGGMGIVYRARQLSFDRVVALKMIRSGEFAGSAEARRFRQEVEAVAALDHPNIVPIHEVGEFAGRAFCTMRLLEGGSLSARIADFALADGSTRLEARRRQVAIARLIATVARAVHHAHQRGILHRDLKPSNILLDSEGEPYVVDFGLARRIGSASSLTVAGAVLGTPSYMAPEQARGGSDVTTQADVYGLGAVLYELLTGQPPFKGKDALDTVAQVREREVIRPSAIRPAIDRDLETICLKCLSKDAVLRYGSAEALSDDLEHWRNDEPILARRIGRLERARKWMHRNPAVAALLGLTALLVLVIAGGGVVMSLQLKSALNDSEADRRQAEVDRDAARDAEAEGKEKLYQSLISKAKAERYSRRIGQRYGTLEAVRQAVSLGRELNKPPAAFDELRNFAIAALALPDMRPTADWISNPNENRWHVVFREVDPGLRYDAVSNTKGDVSIRRVGTNPGEIGRIPGFGHEAVLTWSPDGRILGVTHWKNKRIEVWHLKGTQLTRIIEEQNGGMVLGFSATGDKLILAGSQRLKIFDLPSGQLSRSLPFPENDGGFLIHHPRLPIIAFVDKSRVRLLNLTTGKVLDEFQLLSRAWSLAWHPGGELLAVAGEDHAEVWDVTRKRLNYRLDHHGGGLRVAFNGRGDLLATGGWGSRLKLWNSYTGHEVFASTGYLLRFGPDDRLATSNTEAWKDGTGPVMQVEAAREYRTMIAGVGRNPAVHDYRNCSIHPNGRLVAIATLQGVGFLDLATGDERVFLPAFCFSVFFEPSGALLTSTSKGLHRWPVVADPGMPNRLRVGPPEQILLRELTSDANLACSWDGQILAASIPHATGAIVWQRDRPGDAIHLQPHTDCRTVAVSPDGTFVATGSHGKGGLKVWQARNGKLLREFLPHATFTIPIFSPDGRWLLNQTGESWKVDDWSEGPRHIGFGVGIGITGGYCAFAPDMRLAAWNGHKGVIPLVDPETGREIARLEDPHQDALGSLTFSPDGTRLLGVTTDSFCVRVWDLRKIRMGLKELDLDWHTPPYPSESAGAVVQSLQIELIGASDFLSR